MLPQVSKEKMVFLINGTRSAVRVRVTYTGGNMNLDSYPHTIGKNRLGWIRDMNVGSKQ